MIRKTKIKSGDEVIVISGRSKGKKGRVLKVISGKERVIVQGVHMVRKHTRPSQSSSGGIMEKESSLHISNVSLLDPLDGRPVRSGYKILEDGKKVRVSRRTGEIINGVGSK